MDEKLKVIIEAETADLKKGTKEAKEEIEKLGKTSKVNLKDMEEGFQKAGSAVKAGAKVVVGAVAGITTALLATGPATEEYRIGQAKLKTAFENAGASAETAKDTYNDLYRVLGDSDVAVEASNHLAKLTQDQQSLSEWTTICQGVYATFGDSLPIEGLTEAANETAKTGSLTGVLADALNWAGVAEDDFQAKLDACNTESEREATIRETLNDLYTASASAYETNAADILAQNDAQRQLNDTMASFGEAMEPINTLLLEFSNDVLKQIQPDIEKFVSEHGPEIEELLNGIAEGAGDITGFISDHWDQIVQLATIIGAISAAIILVNGAIAGYNAVMAIAGILTAPMLITIGAISIAILFLVQNWDRLKEKTGSAIDNIKKKLDDWKAKFDETKKKVADFTNSAKEKFEDMKKGINDKIEKVKDVVKKGVQKLKDFFNFEWKLPKIKLPHFKISGHFSLDPPSIPHFSVNWYAKGGVFDKPNLFGYGNGMLGGLGEAGAEAVVPLEKNTEWLDKIAERLRGNGNQNIILQVDGRVFGEVAVDSINSLTRQTGALQLKLV